MERQGEKNVYVRIKELGDRGGSEDILPTLYPSLKYSYMFLYDVVPLPCKFFKTAAELDP